MTGIFDWGISNCQDRLRVTPLKTNVEPRNSRKVPRANFWVFHWWRCDLQIHDFGDLNTKNADLITVIRRAERQCAFGMAMFVFDQTQRGALKSGRWSQKPSMCFRYLKLGVQMMSRFPKVSLLIIIFPIRRATKWAFISHFHVGRCASQEFIFAEEARVWHTFPGFFEKKNCFVEGSKVCQPCLAKWLASIRSAGAGWSHDGRWPSSTTMPPHGKNWAF